MGVMEAIPELAQVQDDVPHQVQVADGGFVTSHCRQDDRLKPLGGLIVSYCGLLAPLGGAACGMLCHFDMTVAR
jgi:hypothetical protein